MKWATNVDVLMSDSAAIHFYSYIGGELVDKYGNAAFPFFQFKTSEEVSEFQGKLELWVRYLQDVHDITVLRSLWVQEWGADKILSQTMQRCCTVAGKDLPVLSTQHPYHI